MWNPLKRESAPVEGIGEVNRKVVELQSDVTLLYDQLERINNRLKQRASRQAHSTDDHRADLSAADTGAEFVAPLPAGEGEDRSSSSPVVLTSLPQSLPTKEQVRELWRRRNQA